MYPELLRLDYPQQREPSGDIVLRRVFVSNVALTLTSAADFKCTLGKPVEFEPLSVTASLESAVVLRELHERDGITSLLTGSAFSTKGFVQWLCCSLQCVIMLDTDICQVFIRGTKTKTFLAKVRLVFLHLYTPESRQIPCHPQRNQQ